MDPSKRPFPHKQGMYSSGEDIEGTESKHKELNPFPTRDYTDRNLIETHEELQIEREFIDYFVQHSEGRTPCWDAVSIKQFCSSVPSRAWRSDAKSKMHLYDCEYGTHRSRDYPTVLAPEELREALKLERFGHARLPDASRRQIMVKNLDASGIYVLAETAACHQVDALRSAISNHISGETAIKVRKPLDGHDKPRLELHLPYLALRKVPQDKIQESGSRFGQQTERWNNFLVPNFNVPEGEPNGHYIIHEARISIVLCIWDHTKWVAYGFCRPCPDDPEEHSDEEDMDSSEGQAEDVEGQEDDLVPGDDIFAPDNGLLNLRMDNIIWEPRKYFLYIMAVWLEVVCQEYTYLVQTLDANVKTFRIETRNTASEALCGGKRINQATRSLNSTVETMQLLREVREHMLPVIRAWQSFHESDMAFFADLVDSDLSIRVALYDMKSAFEKLVDLEQKLVFLDKYFADSANILKLRLTLESNDINRHAHEINMKTNLISRDIQELNRRSTNAAIANVEAARRTNWTTQINVMVIWITTPLILVLQYFSAETPIFPFERNTKTFVIAVCIVFVALPLLTFVLNTVDYAQKAVREMLSVGKKQTVLEKEHSEAIELQQIRPVCPQV